MKLFKKSISVLVVLSLLFAISIPAFADDSEILPSNNDYVVGDIHIKGHSFPAIFIAIQNATSRGITDTSVFYYVASPLPNEGFYNWSSVFGAKNPAAAGATYCGQLRYAAVDVQTESKDIWAGVKYYIDTKAETLEVLAYDGTGTPEEPAPGGGSLVKAESDVEDAWDEANATWSLTKEQIAGAAATLTFTDWTVVNVIGAPAGVVSVNTEKDAITIKKGTAAFAAGVKLTNAAGDVAYIGIEVTDGAPVASIKTDLQAGPITSFEVTFDEAVDATTLTKTYADAVESIVVSAGTTPVTVTGTAIDWDKNTAKTATITIPSTTVAKGNIITVTFKAGAVKSAAGIPMSAPAVSKPVMAVLNTQSITTAAAAITVDTDGAIIPSGQTVTVTAPGKITVADGARFIVGGTLDVTTADAYEGKILGGTYLPYVGTKDFTISGLTLTIKEFSAAMGAGQTIALNGNRNLKITKTVETSAAGETPAIKPVLNLYVSDAAQTEKIFADVNGIVTGTKVNFDFTVAALATKDNLIENLIGIDEVATGNYNHPYVVRTANGWTLHGDDGTLIKTFPDIAATGTMAKAVFTGNYDNTEELNTALTTLWTAAYKNGIFDATEVTQDYVDEMNAAEPSKGYTKEAVVVPVELVVPDGKTFKSAQIKHDLNDTLLDTGAVKVEEDLGNKLIAWMNTNMAYDWADPTDNEVTYTYVVTWTDGTKTEYAITFTDADPAVGTAYGVEGTKTIVVNLLAGTFDATEGAEVANWTITGNDGKSLGAITDVTLSNENKTATITVTNALATGKIYTVTPKAEVYAANVTPIAGAIAVDVRNAVQTVATVSSVTATLSGEEASAWYAGGEQLYSGFGDLVSPNAGIVPADTDGYNEAATIALGGAAQVFIKINYTGDIMPTALPEITFTIADVVTGQTYNISAEKARAYVNKTDKYIAFFMGFYAHPERIGKGITITVDGKPSEALTFPKMNAIGLASLLADEINAMAADSATANAAAVTLNKDFTLGANKTLTIPQGVTLATGANTLTVTGVLTNNGTVQVDDSGTAVVSADTQGAITNLKGIGTLLVKHGGTAKAEGAQPNRLFVGNVAANAYLATGVASGDGASAVAAGSVELKISGTSGIEYTTNGNVSIGNMGFILKNQHDVLNVKSGVLTVTAATEEEEGAYAGNLVVMTGARLNVAQGAYVIPAENAKVVIQAGGIFSDATSKYQEFTDGTCTADVTVEISESDLKYTLSTTEVTGVSVALTNDLTIAAGDELVIGENVTVNITGGKTLTVNANGKLSLLANAALTGGASSKVNFAQNAKYHQADATVRFTDASVGFSHTSEVTVGASAGGNGSNNALRAGDYVWNETTFVRASTGG